MQAVSVVPLLGVGFATGLAVKDEVSGWYKRLDKPFWTPPGWVFGPVRVSALQSIVNGTIRGLDLAFFLRECHRAAI